MSTTVTLDPREVGFAPMFAERFKADPAYQAFVLRWLLRFVTATHWDEPIFENVECVFFNRSSTTYHSGIEATL